MKTSTPKGKGNRRLDKNRITLRTGESQRADGTYSFRWTSRDGQRHNIYAPTLDELREKEERVKVDEHDGIKTEVKQLTVNDVFDLWCDVKRGIKDNTMKNYIYMYTMFVRSSFGKFRITMVKKSDVKRFYNKLADDRILKVSTIDTVHNVLHQVFALAVDDNMIRSNPTDNTLTELKKAHNYQNEKRKALTVDEQNLFMDYLKKNPMYNHWYPIFAVMLGTGMRVGELVGLRWCDIDLDEKMIDVNHTLVYYNHGGHIGPAFSINTPKTKAGNRTIPMMDFVRDAFITERERQKEAGITCVASVDGYTDFIFLNRFGQFQHQGTLNKAIRRIIRDCNYEVLERGEKDPVLLPPFSCHSLRRTFTTRMCEDGVNIKVIQEILGHQDISTTLDIYTDVTKDLKRKELANFETKLGMVAQQ